MSILKTLTINGTTYSVTPVVPASSVTLYESEWVQNGDVYSQVVEVPGVTPTTKVDLQPTSEQLAEFHYKVLAFVAENAGGVVTVYSIGDKPADDHTIQITKTEVAGAAIIRGNTVGTTMPQPDWNQTDPNAADYIRNKPDISGGTGGAGVLIVTLDGGIASHTSEQIYNHVQAGGTVYIDRDGWQDALNSCDAHTARFQYVSAEDGSAEEVCIYEDGSYDLFSGAFVSMPTGYLALTGEDRFVCLEAADPVYDDDRGEQRYYDTLNLYGDNNAPVRITNVAPGAAPYHAVNKAQMDAATKLYRHQITLSGNDDYIYLDGCECDPYIHIEIYNRNPNAMTVSDIVNGGHIPFVTCLPFYADDYDGRFSGRCAPLYFDADNGIIRIVIAPLNGENSGDYDLQIPMNYFYVNDTVTEI